MIRDFIGLQEPLMKHISTLLVNTGYAPDVEIGRQIAAMASGLIEGFQGKSLQDSAAIGTNLYKGLAANKSYVVTNTNQVLMLATRNTGASIDAESGIVLADGSKKRGGLLLKTTLVSGAGMVLAQDDALWLHSKNNFDVSFGIESVSGQDMSNGTIQLGVSGELEADADTVSEVPSDSGYFAVEIKSNMMRLIGKDDTTAVNSPWARLPVFPCVLTLKYSASNKRREVELLVNHQPITSMRMPDAWDSGLQVCCRVGTTGVVTTAMGVELAGIVATCPNLSES